MADRTAIQKKADAAERTKKILLSVLVWAGGILMVFPFLWMLSASFKGVNDVFNFPIEWIPKNPTLHGYELVLRGKVPFSTYLFNSVKIAAISLIGTFFSCTLAGFSYAKIRFSGRDKWFMLKLMTTMIPGMVTILPTYIIYAKMGLINTHAALWLPTFFGGTYGVFIMRQAFMSLPNELLEAAKIDGASYPGIYWRVALPNVKPAISTLLFMYFIWTWNDYERPLLYLRDRKLFTLPFAVKFFADEQSQNYPAIMAANVLMLLPIIILFFVAQKSFVESLVSSSVKG